VAELPRDWYEKTAGLLAQVADAVQAAHEAGIVHRDIKPGNILITRDGQPKVADFGLAMVVDDLHRSRSGELIGTPFYMSPEQAAGARTGLDHRTDVFSLGTTLYESLTLERPFEGETREKVVEQILLHEPPDARRMRPSVPRDLAVICMKALAKRRERRYQSAVELADELRRWLASEPILAKPPGPVLRAGKWVRRNPVRTGFAAAFTVMAGLLLLVHRQDMDLAARLTYSNEREVELRKFAEVSARSLFESLADVEAPRARPADGSPILERIDSVIEQAGLLGAYPEASETQAYLLTVAGASLRDVSCFERAGECLDQALQAVGRMDAADPEVPEVRANVLVELGRLHFYRGEWEQAEALLRESREILARAHGEGSEQAFGPTKVLAMVLLRSGRADESQGLLEATIEAAGGSEGDALVSLLAERLLGYQLLERGRLDEAVELIEPAYARAQPLLTAVDYAQFGAIMAQLGDKRGRAAASVDAERARELDVGAEQLFKDSIARLREQRPDPSERTAEALSSFGSFLSARQRYPEARLVLEEAVRMGLLALGPDHPVTHHGQNNLAALDYHEHREAEAEAGWSAIVESDRRIGYPDLTTLGIALQNLATLCFNQGRYADARPFAVELVERTPEGDDALPKRRALLDRIESRLTSQAAAPPK
jgi:tetratricopeptide (TPR) repeat protein